MSEHNQQGTATHLPGAEVNILDAGRHFGKIGRVVARTVFLGKLAAMVRLQTFRKGRAQIVRVTIPDVYLERTPASLVTKVNANVKRLAETLRPPVGGDALGSARLGIHWKERARRHVRNQIAAASRKKNRG